MLIIVIAIGFGNFSSSYATLLVSPSLPLTSGMLGVTTTTFTSPSQGIGTTQIDSSVVITSAVDGNGNGVENGGSTISNSMTFQFQVAPGSNAGSGFECSREGEPFSDCVSGITYRNLVTGFHTFNVRTGDTGVPTTFTWTITELTSPTVEPLVQPSLESLESTSIATDRKNNANQRGVNTATLAGNIENN